MENPYLLFDKWRVYDVEKSTGYLPFDVFQYLYINSWKSQKKLVTVVKVKYVF